MPRRVTALCIAVLALATQPAFARQPAGYDGTIIESDDPLSTAVSSPAPAATPADAPVGVAPAAGPAAAASPAAQPALADETIVLSPGDVRVIDLPGVVRVAVGSGRIVSARAVDGRQLVLMPQAPGSTTLLAWLRGGRQWRAEVVVPAATPRQTADEVRRILASEPGLTVNPVGSRVLIEGRYASAEAQARVEAALRVFPQVSNLAAPAPRRPRQMPHEPMIHLDVKVFEVRKSALERLGIRWNTDGMRGPVAATSGYAYANTTFRGTDPGAFPVTTSTRPWVSYLGLATEITSVIDLLEQGGDGWTLAEPRLSCKSGGESRFVVGGEIPIPVTTSNGSTNVVYKAYGVIVEFRPVVDADGNVASSIVTEVSEPDPRNSNQGFVAFAKNRTETEFFLRQDETLVISGLLKNGGARALSGVPGLSRLPVLGHLFRSDEFSNARTELVVMVTPRVATPDSAVSQAALRRAMALAEEAQQRIARRLAD